MASAITGSSNGFIHPWDSTWEVTMREPSGSAPPGSRENRAELRFCSPFRDRNRMLNSTGRDDDTPRGDPRDPASGAPSSEILVQIIEKRLMLASTDFVVFMRHGDPRNK
jgi:hypothetical protein